MKKFIAYVVGISLIAGCGYHLYKQSKSELKVASLSSKPVMTPNPTYEPTYIIHNQDGSIDFKMDIEYLNSVNPETTPETVIVTNNEDGSITFKKVK